MYCKNNPINYVDPSGHWKLALAGAGYGYIFGSGAAAVGVGTVVVVGGSILIITGIVIASTYYRNNKAVKVRLKRSKAKTKEKSKSKSKSKSANDRPTSKKVWQRGKTEGVEVENYGNGRGNIHYHEPNNTKWYYSIARKWFEYSNGRRDPSRIQKLLKDSAIKNAIQKAVRYLDK